ncbi:thiamine pyrophosphate-dependent dehydrogenase E1 component subunit alpha [Streptomyces sp. SL13]|uniref:Thiamine pyrophosphate-dependent dehydrogenase E1 component subunit alpha n=1 Tax=Streptantibioticus silvisoli TaxID=2705255 RepID=A0AA90KH66_9ACTN|nr:thiamine pyrophosphate-dependent dehydrogenase E1 component subunit alpha [Streptantibioticus silvisoli]MDI5971039.1 thiamine pyrophosphate-dependent dehydrogenase E1 component subunit alpha [Streptantibioticus silvisoli]
MTPTAPPHHLPLAEPADRYRAMRLVRGFEEQALDLVREGVIAGGIHPYIGQEAVAVGVCAALRGGDLITSTHRGHGHVLAKGASPHRMLAELAGRVTGLNRGRGGSMHAADFSLGILGANGIVGAGAPIAAGAAWAEARAGRDTVVTAFFGDGALNQGVLLETFNLAAIWRLPVLFVCENNGYATTLPAAGAVAGGAVERARAFGIPAQAVDGMDCEAVLAAAAGAVERARAGDGPSFLECRTYRFEGHHTMERRLKLGYRTAEEVAGWRERDPLPRAAAALDPGEADRIDAGIGQLLADARTFALASPAPDISSACDYLYADGLRPRAGVTL